LLPPDHTEVLKPSHCRRCGHALQGDDTQPLRHQVLELPKIRPEVTEYQLHRLRCPACGLSTCAALPAGVPTGGQGPRLQATLALMTGAYRMTKRMVQTFCADVLGVPVCAGQVCACEADMAAATEPVVQQLREYVKSQPANVDETGWWRHPGRHGLHHRPLPRRNRRPGAARPVGRKGYHHRPLQGLPVVAAEAAANLLGPPGPRFPGDDRPGERGQ
jgi:hypothetical protein